MALEPGTTKGPFDRFTGSMADEMEKAFKDEFGRDISDRHLKIIFVAIARGVVKHLADNPDAFNVRLDAGTTGKVSNIETNP